MLFMKGHGGHAIYEDPNTGYSMSNSREARAVCGYGLNEGYPSWEDADLGPFGYLCLSNDDAPHGDAVVTALSDVASDMIDQDPQDDGNSNIPAAYTYFGQFIDHDITAGTDREESVSRIDTPDLTPLPRAMVVEQVANLRTGRLDLDSLYGGAVLQGNFARSIVDAKLLRHPDYTAMMRLGTTTNIPGQSTPLPDDPGRDLLRLGRLLHSGQVSEASINSLPQDLQDQFTQPDGQLNLRRAIIGDGRNDENLAVAQFHLAMARFHNVNVIYANTVGGPSDPRSEDTFEFARKRTTWTYQWLILNDYLPRICDPAVVSDVLAKGAPAYADFLARTNSNPAKRLPLPLEFSVAAFRFGHTMARPDYDWNRHFGRGDAPLKPRAQFEDLFRLTGGASPPLHVIVNQGTSSEQLIDFPTLPDNWVIEWDRFVDDSGAHPDRFARKLDTRLAPDLLNMLNEPQGMNARMKHLAERNLRRSLRLNIPSAQNCIAHLDTLGITLASLDKETLKNGAGGAALEKGGLLDATPLWYYILREAEVAGGNHLGPLGSRIVAETLCGLVISDPESYWAQSGSDNGRWHPEDGIKPKGQAITTAEKMLSAAGLIA